MILTPTDIERFWRKVDKTHPTGCWPWEASLGGSRGYGQFELKGKTPRAHRVAWVISYGEIPAGLFVLHKCDNRLCCNPSHLFLGTAHDNTQDMMKKGRHRITNHKLTEFDVSEIRLRLCAGERQCDLVREFGVSPAAICMVSSGKSWRNV